MVKSVPIRSIFRLVRCFQISNQNYCLFQKDLTNSPSNRKVVCIDLHQQSTVRRSSDFFFLMEYLPAWSVHGPQDPDTTSLSLQFLSLTWPYCIYPNHSKSLTGQENPIPMLSPKPHLLPHPDNNIAL